jgi:GntR family transcriptional regulator
MGPDEAALAINRLANVHKDPIEWRRTFIRGDRFSLVAESSAGTGYQFGLTNPGALGV